MRFAVLTEAENNEPSLDIASSYGRMVDSSTGGSCSSLYDVVCLCNTILPTYVFISHDILVYTNWFLRSKICTC